MNLDKRHNEHTRIISLKPSIIGLSDIVLATGESNIFEDNHLYRQPDNLMFDPSTHTLYNVEYKCNNSTSRRTHAINQLHCCEKDLKEVFPNWRVVNLYISNDYKVERVW